MSQPRRREFGEERRNGGERSRSDTSHGTGDAEPSHPVHLTSLGAQHIPHLAPEHTPRGCPATARPAPRGEADGNRHGRMLSHSPRRVTVGPWARRRQRAVPSATPCAVALFAQAALLAETPARRSQVRLLTSDYLVGWPDLNPP